MAKEKNGFVGDYYYCVGVMYKNNEVRFVDSVDYSDKSAAWTAGAKAMQMDKQSAIQLQMGLMCNGSTALVIEVPEFTELYNRESYGS